MVRITAFNKETKSAAEVEGTCDINLMLASSIPARAPVKNPKAWGLRSLKFLFFNAGKFTPQQAEGPSNS